MDTGTHPHSPSTALFSTSPGSQSLLAVRNSEFSIRPSRFSILHSQFALRYSSFSILHSQFSILHSSFAILNSLPIDPLVPGVVDRLAASPNLVLVAPPGAGKTTRVPPAIADASFVAGRSVVVLQPRRVAARAAAARVAAERGWRLGGRVGYRVRFDDRSGPDTRVLFLTEGILARRLQNDPFVEEVGCVLLDEFHERSLDTDLAVAMLREIQRTVRPDLRIVVMSATTEPEPVAAFLGEAPDRADRPAPVVRSEGRGHPVEIERIAKSVGPASDPATWDEVARRALAEILSPATEGHALVFLPGMREIRRLERAMRPALEAAGLEVRVLHGSVSPEEQDAAIRPSPDRRRVVLATNVAETSITIDGVRLVVDSGWARVPSHDPRLGIDRLELKRVSLASADQRAGRAGRTAPGRCLRLWTAGEEAHMAANETPEVARADLAAATLALAVYGARDPAAFAWFQPPPPARLAAAVALLRALGAIDHRGRATDEGRRLAALPLHPRLARLCLSGADAGYAREAATIAALLSEERAAGRNPRVRADVEADSDAIEMLDAFETEAARGGTPLGRVAAVRDDLLRIVGPQRK